MAATRKTSTRKATTRRASTRKPKSYVLVKPIDGVFSRTDETFVTFQEADVGLSYSAADPGVKRAVEIYPDCFKAE